MYTTLRASILGIALLASAGCAMDDVSPEGDEAVDIELAPDPDTDPNAGGSQAGDASCGAVPASGSDPQQIAYSTSKDGDCCWQNYNQKTYRKYKVYYLLCQL